MPPERLHAAFDDGEAIAGAGVFEFQLTVPGGRVPAAGVTTVAVLPTHRRRGILRDLMRAQLDDVHERGESVAYLLASEATIYGRFGYGLASSAARSTSARAAASSRASETAGRVRLVSRDEALEAFPPIYERVAVETPGMFSRTREWWESRPLNDPDWRRGGGGELNYALLEIDGRAEGYALYRLNPSFEYGSSTGTTSVIEAMGATPAAVASIWRFVLDIDWMDQITRWTSPGGPSAAPAARRAAPRAPDARRRALAPPRRRGAALSGRAYLGDDSVVLGGR